MILFDKHRRARKNMSAYADGELSAKEVAKLEAHVAACERCRLELDELRSTIGALRSFQEATPRKSFQLTPQMVEAPVPARYGGPSPKLVQGMRLTAAGLAAALVLVFVIDVADSRTSDNDSGATGAFFTAGGALERATDGASPEAADGADDLAPLSDDEEIPATTAPEPAYGLADAPPDNPTAYPAYGGVTSDVDSGDGGGSGGSSGGDVAEPDGGAGTDGSIGGLPATGDSGPDENDGDTETGSDQVPEKSLDDSADQSTTGDSDDAAGGEAVSLTSDDDGGFDTLLALEIGLGAALAAALAGAIWLTVAARRRETGP